MAKKASIFI